MPGWTLLVIQEDNIIFEQHLFAYKELQMAVSRSNTVVMSSISNGINHNTCNQRPVGSLPGELTLVCNLYKQVLHITRYSMCFYN